MHLCLVFPQLLSLAVFVGWLDCTCSFVGTLFILGQKLNKRIIFAGEVMTCGVGASYFPHFKEVDKKKKKIKYTLLIHFYKFLLKLIKLRILKLENIK